MKKATLLLLLASISLSSMAQTDEDAIKKVIADETTAFYNKDAKAMVSFWHPTPQTTMYVVVSPDRVISHGGSFMTVDSVQSMMTGEPQTVDFLRTNWGFCMSGTVAYVTFDQALADENQYSHEIRLMEKIGGDWKIVSSNVVLLNKH